MRPIDELKIENAVLLYLRRIDRGGPKKRKLSRREQDRCADIAWKLVEDLRAVMRHATAVSADLAREQAVPHQIAATA